MSFTKDWLYKLWYVYTMEYSLPIKNGDIDLCQLTLMTGLVVQCLIFCASNAEGTGSIHA